MNETGPSSATHGPYGESIYTSPGTIDTPGRFAQDYRDQETGLAKLGTRYYDTICTG